MLDFTPKWHDPSQDELSFANELLEFHFQSALEDLLTICKTKLHSETGNFLVLTMETTLYAFFLIWVLR